MKKLIALIAVLGFVPYAHAADGADFSHSGEFRLQYTNDMNADLNDDAADSPDQTFHQRLKWGTTVRAGEKMTGHFTLVHNADWGMNPDQTPDDVTNTTTGKDGDTSNLLIVNEAYMTWMASDAWMLKMGRGSVTMADGRFVSANDFGPVAKAFDGALAMWDQEIAKFSFFGVRGADFDKLGGNFNETGDFFGVSADFKSLPSFMKSAHVHIVQVKRNETAALGGLDKEDNMKIGFNVTGEVAGLDWRLNYEMEDGENEASGVKSDIKASMIDAEVGYAMPEMMNSRVHFGYHTDTGNDASATAAGDREYYDGFHYDTHANAGLMDIIGWGNLTYMRLGGTMMPSDDITVGLEYLMFSQTEKDGVSFGTGGFTNVIANNAAEDELGNEIDLWVTKKYSNNFSATARYSLFQPGDEFGASPDDRSQMYLETKLTF